MTCTNDLISLPCDLSGVGNLAAGYSGGASLDLLAGHGANFPAVAAGKHYYAVVTSSGGCCARVKVTGKVNDTLSVTLLGTLASNTCLGIGSQVTMYDIPVEIVQDVVMAMGINVQPPLIYDCATRTLSLDCTLMTGGCSPCA